MHDDLDVIIRAVELGGLVKCDIIRVAGGVPMDWCGCEQTKKRPGRRENVRCSGIPSIQLFNDESSAATISCSQCGPMMRNTDFDLLTGY